jgi:hypothetical protein
MTELEDLLEVVVVGLQDHEGLVAEDVGRGRVDGDDAGVVTLLDAHGGVSPGPCPRPLARRGGALLRMSLRRSMLARVVDRPQAVGDVTADAHSIARNPRYARVRCGPLLSGRRGAVS